MSEGTYEIIRMPAEMDKQQEILTELSPFLAAMYPESDEKLFGELKFKLDHWLFLWDTGAGSFLTKRNKAGELVFVAMLTQYEDIWHGRPLLDIHRATVMDGLDHEEEINGAFDYLKSIASLMKFNLLYYTSRDDKGNIYRHLIWNGDK